MQPLIFPVRSIWFSSLVGLLVALGVQVLIDAVTPVDLIGSGGIYRIANHSLWVGDTVVRFLSFTLGGFVCVLLAQIFSIRLMVMILISSVLPTMFTQFPRQASIFWIVAWSVSAPVGMLLGAWLAYFKHKAV